MDNIIYCSHHGCRLPLINNSNSCWEHLDNKEEFRNDLEMSIKDGVEYSDAIFSDADLSGLDLSGIIAPRADFSGADLSGCRMNRANLQFSKLNRCRLESTELNRADLKFAQLNNCIGTISAVQTDFSESSGRFCCLIESDLTEARFCNSDWKGAKLMECKLVSINGKRWHAPWADFSETDLSHAECEFAVLGGCLMDGVIAEFADFKCANLLGVSGRNAIFRNACFYYARLTAGCFDESDFNDADLTRAVLRTANFINVQMAGSKIIGAVLDRARFRKRWEPDNETIDIH